jgi:hypothetical protein
MNLIRSVTTFLLGTLVAVAIAFADDEPREKKLIVPSDLARCMQQDKCAHPMSKTENRTYMFTLWDEDSRTMIIPMREGMRMMQQTRNGVLTLFFDEDGDGVLDRAEVYFKSPVPVNVTKHVLPEQYEELQEVYQELLQVAYEKLVPPITEPQVRKRRH